MLRQVVLLQHAQRLDSQIIYDRDFDYDYFGFKVRHAVAARLTKRIHITASLLFVMHVSSASVLLITRVTIAVLWSRSRYVFSRSKVCVHHHVTLFVSSA